MSINRCDVVEKKRPQSLIFNRIKKKQFLNSLLVIIKFCKTVDTMKNFQDILLLKVKKKAFFCYLDTNSYLVKYILYI